MDCEDLQERLGRLPDNDAVVVEISDMQSGKMLVPVTDVDTLVIAKSNKVVVRLHTA